MGLHLESGRMGSVWSLVGWRLLVEPDRMGLRVEPRRIELHVEPGKMRPFVEPYRSGAACGAW